MRRERDRLLSILHELLPGIRVLEVGSTAVPGVLGKEDVDLLVLATTHQFAAARVVLDKQFLRDHDQLSSKIYQGYMASSEWDVSIQLTVMGSGHDTFERFMDILNRDAVVRRGYNNLKRAWDGRPMSGYRAAKSRFIEAALGDDG